MVKKDKKKRMKEGYDLEGVIAQPGEPLKWHTTVHDMMLDDDGAQPGPSEQQPAEVEMGGAAAPKQKQPAAGGAGTAMDTGEGPKRKKAKGATTTIPGLGVVHHSLKRGDRTTNQKKRKAVKLAKAIARSERSSTKVSTKQDKKQSKLALKHIY